jgi:hypothetical protein
LWLQDAWDCESIISTYSTLDNHPTVVRDPKTKFKPYKSRFQRDQEAQALSQYSDTASLASSRKSKASTTAPSPVVLPLSGKIVLSGKLNLPLGFAPGSQVKAQGQIAKMNTKHLSGIPENKVNDSDDDDDEENEDEDDSGSDDDPDNDNNNNQQNETAGEEGQRPTGWVEKEKKVKARKKESAEEKKARKQATKEERKNKRVEKKQLKTMFKDEGTKYSKSVGNEQTINHVSVFKYSH